MPLSKLRISFIYFGVFLYLALIMGLSEMFQTPLTNRVQIFENPWLDPWVNWDGQLYYLTAKNGYTHTPTDSNTPFFPTFPLLMKLLAPIFGHLALAGMAINLFAGLGTILLFYKWCLKRMSSKAALLSILALMLSPFSFYLFGTNYADSLFIFFAISSFTMLENDKPFLAGILGALAWSTRILGLCVFVGLVLCSIERRGGLTKVKLKDLGVLLCALGPGIYCFYLWYNFDAPLAFLKAYKLWVQTPFWDKLFKVPLYHHFFTHKLMHHYYSVVLIIHIFLFLLGLFILPEVKKRFGRGYTGFALVVFLLTITGTKDFLGFGRYILVAFPIFAIVGEKIENNSLRKKVLFYCSFFLLTLTTSWFARWIFVA